jgi:riboflavin kinase/FMN adenylyltransferase
MFPYSFYSQCCIGFEALEHQPYDNTYITIGNFDGVHLGHQALINRMVQEAQNRQYSAIVITFFPDPLDFFHPEIESYYLSTLDGKKDMLKKIGVDDVITFRFDRDFADLSAQQFLSGLKAKLGLQVLLVGEDFALGKNRKGTIPVIKSIGEKLDFSVETITPVIMADEEISSTRIRSLLDQGDVIGAARLLGRPYSISGLVTHGSDRGSRIGLPTANLNHWVKKKQPAVGVYATRVSYQQDQYFGITNVGHRPTFENQEKPNIETFIFDFDENIYGKMIQLEFIQKIRDEQKFASVDDFLAQIEKDKAAARKIFNYDKT